MDNKPILFVETVMKNNDGFENQNMFDSRKKDKNKKTICHRLDDLKAFISLGKKVDVFIETKEDKYTGFVIGLDNEYIFISKEEIEKIAINNIISLRILNIS